MKITVPDIRAICIIIAFSVVSFVCFEYDHTLVGQIIGFFTGILAAMFLRKMYHREIKGDYYSRYDKIPGSDVEDTEEIETEEINATNQKL